MKTAEQFLDSLDGKDLVDERILSQLRAQAQQATSRGKTLSAEKVSDLLVDKEYLTRRQAKALIDALPELDAGEDDELSLTPIDDGATSKPAVAKSSPSKPSSSKPSSSKPSAAAVVNDDDDDLGLAPLDDDSGKNSASASKPAPKPASKPASKAAPVRQEAKPAQKPAPKQAPKSSASLLEEELGLGGNSGGGSLLDDLMGSGNAGGLGGSLGGGLPGGNFGGNLGGGLPGGLPGDPLSDPFAQGNAGGVLPTAPKKKKGFAKFFDKVSKGVGAKKTKEQKRQQMKAKAENPWESKLMLLGGGGLMILVIVGVVLFLVLSQRTGDEAFEECENAYHQGSYAQAIVYYDKFIEKNPNYSQIGLAKVHRGLAQMRNSIDGTDNWTQALSETKKVLSEITSISDFPNEAPPELSALLPQVAENLALEAFTQTNVEKLDQAKEAKALLEKFVPASKRPATLTQNLDAMIAQAEDKLLCEKELAVCLKEMDAKVAEGDSQGAYVLRDNYLKRFPLLRTDERILAAVEKVSAIESKAVSYTEAAVAAVTTDNHSLAGRVVLALSRTEKTAGAVKDQILLVPGKDIFGVNATDGQVKWICPQADYFSFRTLPFRPTFVSSNATADFILLGPNHTLQRRSSQTGELKWSYPLQTEASAQANAFPLLSDKQIFISCTGGQIYKVSVDTGAQTGYFKLPQALGVAPAYDTKSDRLFQPAEHTNLFIISVAEGKCLQTLYLGHSKGDIIVSPVLVGGFLVVAVNTDADNSELRFFPINPEKKEGSDETPAISLLQSIKLTGHVDTRPVVSGNRLLVTTDTGLLTVYEIKALDQQQPFVQIAQFRPDTKVDSQLVRFAAFQNSEVFIGDQMLTRFDVISSSGQLKPAWNKNAPCISTSAPVSLGKTAFHIRGQEPVVVSAHSKSDGNTLWQTELNDRIIGKLTLKDKTLESFTRSGAMFISSIDDFTAGRINAVPDQALQPGDALGGIAQAVRFDNGTYVTISNKALNELMVMDPNEEVVRFRRAAILPDKTAGALQVVGSSLMVPTEKGQIMLVNPKNGQKVAEPFMISLETERTCTWTISQPFDSSNWLAYDGVRLHRIAQESTDTGLKSRLTSKQDIEVGSALTTGIAITAKNALFVAADSGLQILNRSTLQDAKSEDCETIDGMDVAGLWTIGNTVIATLKSGSVLGLDETGKLLWRQDEIGHVQIEPGFDGKTAVLITIEGKAVEINPTDGTIVSSQDSSGKSPSVSPINVQGRWFYGTTDGEILELKLKAQEN